jgi:UDP-N-acetylglucosamine/UDP-N-acetylgalactosamine diphosphorylase
MKKNDFFEKLEKYGQQKFIGIFEGLKADDQAKILEQADLLDLNMLTGIDVKQPELPRGVIEPIRTLTIKEYEAKKDHYRKIGLEAIRAGKIGALLLAGGMGTRLGYDHAKGMYDIGITRPVFIFQRSIENLMDVTKEAGCSIHLYVMTSHLNDTETRAFFEEHNYFGYDKNYIHFYMQDMAACLDREGNMFLAAEDSIAMSPNGNGGFYSSLVNSPCGKQLHDAGIEFINVFAVDNVLQRIADPVFIGATIESGCATGAKVVAKAAPDERVGAICLEDGTPSVVEYYDMTPELMEAKLEDGTPAYNFGVILNYLFRIKDIDEAIKYQLPVHLVNKKVPFLDYADGKPVTVAPEKPNAFKLETLSLDLVHLTDSCLPFEVVREKEFAPIKNPTGIDSVESARKLLEDCGYTL